ncbi:hypothetical protein [Ilumatobacter coccineus]|uniref:Fibronectin type-III domain-containing protein n=1 Tax=Ilumatobacter coccineus (strain NBRC 103263 / KCTC 29153 / YM16-304) TaxID=1313172 RepID=A0A6C7E9A8_ILUCY|nr:hypothetical protein [Ilumatobacter coccineus]BAN02602.1 hypothetical protein YM304_22880 [Ilumatobacter coccineus YM16-304]
MSSLIRLNDALDLGARGVRWTGRRVCNVSEPCRVVHAHTEEMVLRIRLGLSVALACASAMVFVPSGAGAEGSSSAESASVSDAYEGVEFDVSSITADSPDASVTFSVPESVSATVTLAAEGAIDVDDTSTPIALSNGIGTTVVDMSAPLGSASVTATVVAVDANGATSRFADTIWLDTYDGETIVSTVGAQDVELQIIERQAAAGELSAAEASDAATAALSRTDADVVVSKSANLTCGGICVEGTLLWTDSAGGTHPIRQATVQIRERNVAESTDSLITEVTSDDAGTFSAEVSNPDPDEFDGPNRDVFVRVLADGPTFSIVRQSGPGPVYEGQFIDSPLSEEVSNGSIVTTDMTTNQTDPNNTAFSLQNALVIAGEYVLTMQDDPFDSIEVVFPNPESGSYFDTERLFVDALDRWDWDVMLHEYGHYVASELGTEDNPGGTHDSRDHLADTEGRNKDEGIRVAWGEGWPTYFAVSLLQEMNTAELGIPNVGDDHYQDTEDQEVDDDLEAGGKLGEDNEFTVMSILWDLFDTQEDDVDNITLGAKTIWTTLDDGDPKTLSAAYGLFTTAGSEFANDVNCVFSQHNVAPRIAGGVIAPMTSSASSPTISWTPGNGGINGTNDSFVVEYRTTTGELLFASDETEALRYRAPNAEWDAILADHDTAVVTVIGTETQAPETGPYRSCARTFTVDESAPGPVATSLAPKRFVDTRESGDTLDGEFEADGKRTAGSQYEVEFGGRGDVPADAQAVVANVTAIQPEGVGYVTAHACLDPAPLASSLNYTAGVNLGNEVIIGLDDDGHGCLFTSAAAHLTVDVVGFVAADSTYVPVDPARILESRIGDAFVTVDGLSEGIGRTSAGSNTTLQVAGRADVPEHVAAVIVNVTAVRTADTGYVTVHPCLDEIPNSASLNYVAGVNRGNDLIAPVDADGNICLFTSSGVDLTVDVVGAVLAGSTYQPVDPGRFLDTRESGETVDGDQAGDGKLAAGDQVTLSIAGRGDVPSGVSSVVVNVTAVQPEGVGFVTVHPCEDERPLAASLNYAAGVNGGNEIVALLDADGDLCLYASTATHLTVDVSGYLDGST